MTGVSLTGLAGTVGGSAAHPDHASQHDRPDHSEGRIPSEHINAPGWLEKKGNKVELSVTESEYKSVSASDIEGIPDDARRVSFEVLKLQVEAINKEIEANNLKLESGSNGVSLKRTGKTDLSKYGVDQ